MNSKWLLSLTDSVRFTGVWFLFIAAVSVLTWLDGFCPYACAQTKDPFLSPSFDAWSTTDGRPVPSSWEMKDGVIHLAKGNVRGGNIVTKEEFDDFVLSFEFKISPGGNSGIKYRVRNYENRNLGFEYQIYDDEGARKVQPKNSCGALYDLYEPNKAKKTKPAGEWNQAKIVVQGTKIEHWLNGALILTANIGDADWEKRYQASKFNETVGFGLNPKGKIMLTDHGSEVWLRSFVLERASANKEKILK